MYRCAAAVAACSTALRFVDAPLKLTLMPGCVSGRTSGGHTRTRARQKSAIRDGVTLIVQPLYSLTIAGWSTGRGGALEQAASRSVIAAATTLDFAVIRVSPSEPRVHPLFFRTL